MRLKFTYGDLRQVLLLAFICGGLCVHTQSDASPSGQPRSEQQILVTFAADVMVLHRRAGSGLKGYAGNVYRNVNTADYIARQLSQDYSLRLIKRWPVSVLDEHCVLYELPHQSDVKQLISDLNADPRVATVQLMQHFKVRLTASTKNDDYNDPYLKLQSDWGKLDLKRIHDSATGKGIRIALIDTAVEFTHPDLSSSIVDVKSFLPEPIRSAGDYHGTAVAGVIAAEANNHIGIVGVAPDSALLCLEACWREGDGAVCNSFTLAQALNYAIEQHVNIINLSLGGPEDPLLHRLLDVAVSENIAVVVADSDSMESPFPASVPGVIAVGKAGTGKPVSGLVSAPSQNVITTIPVKTYDFVSGSSIAAAYVSGVIALLFDREPAIKVSELPDLLRSSSQPLSSVTTLIPGF